MQRLFSISSFFTVITLSILVVSCDEKPVEVTPPIAGFSISPAQGTTLTVFKFDASLTRDTSLEPSMLFFRWDWNNDDHWDTGFSKATEIEHRYLAPGNYFPRMEVRNAVGMKDTIQLEIRVEQGYSPPRPDFKISPLTGHVRTEFFFDASMTQDDEDSLSTLRFRWDFENDGVFNTGYLQDPKTSHFFSSGGNFMATLEVTDPSGRSAVIRKRIVVTYINVELVPDFTWSPADGTTADLFRFDASASYDPADPSNTFSYRWDFDGNGSYDTEYSASPIAEIQFMEEGEREIRLEIRDQYGLVNNVKKKVLVGHANMPPNAEFFIGSEYGNLTTNFYFNGTPTKDPEDWEYQIKVRWDFESDGIWDTEFSVNREAYHHYGVAGTYRVTMEAMDSGELTDTTSLELYVSSGTNETGIIIDHQKKQYYGTVKIGNQWWTSENLNEPGGYCYNNRSVNCDIYGAFYTWNSAMNSSQLERAQGLCPNGWHIPTSAEWQQLLDFYGETEVRRELEADGSSDFRLLWAGQRANTGRYEYQGSAVNYWTSTRATGSNAFAVSFQAGKDTYWKLSLGQSYGINVRCIKN